MKSTLSLMLIVCLVASAVPVAAQEQTEMPVGFDRRGPAPPAAGGPVAQAIMREAVRLAAVAEPTPSGVDAAQLGAKAAESDWSRVRKLAPGTEIIVTVPGSQPGTRYVVLADESGLTVLNVADPTLPAAARRMLLDMASDHPERFAAAHQRESFVNQNIRVGPAGVFVADRKVADLAQIVERIARTDLETGASTVVGYDTIKHTKNISTGAAIGIGAGIGVLIYLILALIFSPRT